MSGKLHQLEASVFETRLGFFGVAVRDRTILRIVIGHPSARLAKQILLRSFQEAPAFSMSTATSSQILEKLRDSLTDFTHGKQVQFSNFQLDFGHLTPYQKRVAEVVRSIPYGETLSYTQVAELTGSPRAARAVGNVMANNRFPILVPCHRVLAASGKLGGFSAPGGLTFKQALLDLESSRR